MKALSIRQPWAWLILHSHKDVENRSWPTKFRGRIYVHASRTVDQDAMEALAIDPKVATEIGAIVGEVDVTGCITASDSPWFEGPYGFTLANPIAYKEPISYKGQLRLFEVELPPVPICEHCGLPSLELLPVLFGNGIEDKACRQCIATWEAM